MPEAAPRPHAVPWMVAGAAVLGAAAWRLLHAVSPDTPAPEALWRNGVIVEVRHCSQATSEASTLRCAALICAQRVTKQLANAQQTRLTLSNVERDKSTGVIEVNGDLEQALSSPTLPTRFRCEAAAPLLATPTFEYGGRIRGAPSPGPKSPD